VVDLGHLGVLHCVVVSSPLGGAGEFVLLGSFHTFRQLGYLLQVNLAFFYVLLTALLPLCHHIVLERE